MITTIQAELLLDVWARPQVKIRSTTSPSPSGSAQLRQRFCTSWSASFARHQSNVIGQYGQRTRMETRTASNTKACPSPSVRALEIRRLHSLLWILVGLILEVSFPNSSLDSKYHVFPFPSLPSRHDSQGRLPRVPCVCEPSFRLRSEFRLLDQRWIGRRRRACWSPAGQPSACGLRQTSPSAQSPRDEGFGFAGLFTGNSYVD